MNDRTAGTPASDIKKSPVHNKVVGAFLSKIEDVPKEIREYAVNKLNPKDAEGNRLRDGQGRKISASVSVAKENGSYYGPVILNNDKYLVQSVGKDRLYAVVHPKDGLDLQGSTLRMLDSKRQLNNTNVQIHYTGDKAKVYPYSDKNREGADKPKEAPAPARDELKPDAFLAQAAQYAKQNIKNANQREAFMKHLGNVTEQAFNKPPETARAQSKPAPVQAKQADHGIER